MTPHEIARELLNVAKSEEDKRRVELLINSLVLEKSSLHNNYEKNETESIG